MWVKKPLPSITPYRSSTSVPAEARKVLHCIRGAFPPLSAPKIFCVALGPLSPGEKVRSKPNLSEPIRTYPNLKIFFERRTGESSRPDQSRPNPTNPDQTGVKKMNHPTKRSL